MRFIHKINKISENVLQMTENFSFEQGFFKIQIHNSICMSNPFDVLDGNQMTKEILIETLHDKGDRKTGLKEFLTDLEETEERSGNWWVAVDQYDKPRGALTVRFIEGEQMSYLRSIWTRVLRTEDQYIASKALLDAWMSNADDRVKKYQADLPLYSPLIQSIQQAGFQKEKMLLASYTVETDWMISDLPTGYRMRPVEKDELHQIYLDIVEPDLDPASPIYVSEEGFLMFTQRLPDKAMESWVVVENEDNEIIGFAASFLNQGPKSDDDTKQAVLFGPHTKEAKIHIAIIKEMMTYWRSHGIESIRILRVDEFYPSVIDELDLELSNSTIRFVLDKL